MSEDFAHRLSLEKIRDGERLELAANEGERRAVAKRLGLISLDRLGANAILSRNGAMVRARGRVQASLGQSCIVTGEPVAAHVDEPFDLMFMPEPAGSGGDEEIALDQGDCDVVFHDGAAIAIGAAIADTLALAIDPYPRSAGAEAALKEAGVLSEAEAGPFAALAALKKKGES